MSAVAEVADYLGAQAGLVLAITSLTRSGTTATATTAIDHGYADGETHTVAGANESAYNGAVVVTVVSARVFTYTVAGSPTTPATGTVTVTRKVFKNFKPELPDNAVWVMAYGGLGDEPNLGSGGTQIRLQFPRLQIGCRGAANDVATPEALALACEIACMAVLNTTLSGVAYKGLDIVTPPFFLQRDLTNRVEWVQNVQAMKDLS